MVSRACDILSLTCEVGVQMGSPMRMDGGGVDHVRHCLCLPADPLPSDHGQFQLHWTSYDNPGADDLGCLALFRSSLVSGPCPEHLLIRCCQGALEACIGKQGRSNISGAITVMCYQIMHCSSDPRHKSMPSLKYHTVRQGRYVCESGHRQVTCNLL